MKPRTVLGLLVIVAVLGGIGIIGTLQTAGNDGSLSERWVSDTAREATGNHHAPAAKQIGPDTLIAIPVNSNAEQTAEECVLYVFNEELDEEWRASLPPAECNIHSFGDPTIADLDGDGSDEVIVATTENAVRVHDARTGAEVFRRDLAGWGYAAPRVVNFIPDEGRELVVTDLSGGVFVFTATGSPVWNRSLAGSTAPIYLRDFDADGARELALGEGRNVTLLRSDGTIAWQTGIDGSVTWLAVGQADEDAALELVASTSNGRVVAVDGRTGEVEWERDYPNLAAVYAFGDGDRDGQAEVYAVSTGAQLHALDASDGTDEWTTTLTTADVPMTPPPALGDLDGDGNPELVAVAADGVVSVIDPRSGEVIDSYERSVPIWMRPTLTDLDGNGALEIMVTYGDGRVVALSFDSP